MKKFWLVLLIVIFLPVSSTNAQNTREAAITISFDEAAIGDSCENAFNAYAPEIQVVTIASFDYGSPYISDTGEASGFSPECEFVPGSAVMILLNRPADKLSFNRSGSVNVELQRNGEQVGIVDASSGLGGRYERTESNGFDKIVLSESSFNAPVRVDEIEIRFPTHAVTMTVNFDESESGRGCEEAINTVPFLAATVASSTNFLTPMIVNEANTGLIAPECNFDPGNRMIITLDRPAIGVSFTIYGGADIQLFLEGAQVGGMMQASGLSEQFRQTRPDGFDQVVITEPSGFSSFKIDGLHLTFPINLALTVDFSEASDCASAFTGEFITVTATPSPPIVQTNEAGGTVPECEFLPGTAMTITLNRPAIGIRFALFGEASVQLLRDGMMIGEVDQPSGLPTQYQRFESEGFHQIIIFETSAFKVDDLQLFFAE